MSGFLLPSPQCCCHYVGGMVYRPFDQIIGPQILRPDEDHTVLGTDWQAIPIDGIEYTKINEVTPDDLTTWLVCLATAANSPRNCGVRLSNPSPTPDKTQVHRISFRISRDNATATGNCTVEIRLFQGSTLIAATGARNCIQLPTWTTYTYELTPAEVLSITDYDNLFFQIQGRRVSGVDSAPLITWCQLEV